MAAGPFDGFSSCCCKCLVLQLYYVFILLCILDICCLNITNPSDELMNGDNWPELHQLEKLVMCSLDINKVDEYGNTTLFNAASRGNLKVVQVVLGHPKIQLNKPTIDGSTPLYIASQEGHEDIVSTLLATSDILVNKGNAEGISPLQVAAKKGHLSITVLILNHYKIDPNLPDYQDITPLIEATMEGNEPIVAKILLHPRTEANKPTWSGKTALIFACQKLEIGIIRLLLSCPQTDTTLLDENGKSARSYLEDNNDTQILQLFDSRTSLIRNGHSCCSDQLKRGMQIAARSGDQESTGAFLQCPDVNVNDGYESEMTPLYIAVRQEKTCVVKTLLEFTSIRVNQLINGENALLVAVEYGNLELVTVLLQHPEIDTNIIKRGTQGSSLYIASERGFNEIVRQLLQQSQIEVNDVYGSKRTTALSTAAAHQNMNVVKLLLLCPKVDVTMTDSSGKTAIQHAKNRTILVFAMREEFLHMEVHTCCVATNDKLIKAAEIGDHKAIRGLAKCPNSDINTADFKGRTPLYLASMLNNLKAVKEILSVHKLEPNKGRNLDGKTPFSISSEKSYSKVMELLLNHSTVNVNEGWRVDNWQSLKDVNSAPFNNSKHDSSFMGKIFIFIHI